MRHYRVVVARSMSTLTTSGLASGLLHDDDDDDEQDALDSPGKTTILTLVRAIVNQR